MSQLRRIVRCRQKHTQDVNSAKCIACDDRFVCFTNGKIRVPTDLNSDVRYIFEVPNTEEGEQFLALASKFMHPSWTMKKRGRHSDRKNNVAHYRQHSQNDVHIADAEWFALYFNRREKGNVAKSTD